MFMKKLRSLYSNIKELMTRIREDNLTAYSAHAAFFLFISTFPFLIILITMIKYTPLSKDLLYSMLEIDSSNIVLDTIRSWIDEVYGETGSIIPISILAALWASSKGFTGIADNINKIYQNEIKHTFIIYRLLGLAYTIVFAILTMSVMTLVLFGRKIKDWLLNTFDISSDIFKYIIDMRLVIAVIVFLIVILAIYILLPHRKTKIKNELPGAIFTTAGWLIFTICYSAYIEHTGMSRSIYGSLTTIIFFMLWLYFCIYIMFLGAEINLMLNTYRGRVKE